MKNDFIKGNDLPCFKYILENISDSGTPTAASFSLAYIQYLQRCGITEREKIKDAFIKLALVAQRSFVSRKEPLDLMIIKGKRYSFDTDASFEEYMKALLKTCRENPSSFSMLYKKIDTRLSLCHLCPMSSQYSLSYEKEELALARYVFENIANYNKIITCIGDIETLFCSYVDIYNVLNNITHSYSAPLYQILFKSIYTHTSAYFHSIFGTRQYPSIKSSFIKELGKFGLNNRAKNFDAGFDVTVYDYLVTLFSSVELIDETTALNYRSLLMERAVYTPEIDVDALPISLDVTAHKKKGRSEKTSSSAAPGKKRKSYENPSDDYNVKLSLSESFDKISEVKESAEPIGNDFLIEEKVNDQTDEVIEISLLKEDIVSTEGDVIVEHLVEENSVIDFDDEEIDDTLSEEELDEDEEDVVDSMAEVLANKGEIVVNNNDAEPSEPSLASVSAVSSGADSASADSFGDEKSSESNCDTEAAKVKEFSEPPLSEQAFCLSDLLSPIKLSLELLSDSGLEEIIYDNQYDHLISRISLEKFYIIEPACVVLEKKEVDVLLIGLKNERFFLKLSSAYAQRLLDFHKCKAYGVRLICLYSLFVKHGLEYKQKDMFIPLLEELNLVSHPESFSLPVVEYITYLHSRCSVYHADDDVQTVPDSLLRTTLLYTAYGYSLRGGRFFKQELDTLTYSEEGCIQFIESKLPSNLQGLAGKVFDFSFQLPELTPDEKGYFLTQDIIHKMCRGAFFQKFNLQLLYMSTTHLRVYADEYCMEYIYNYILMHFFKIGTRYGLKPMNVVVETHPVISFHDANS